MSNFKFLTTQTEYALFSSAAVAVAGRGSFEVIRQGKEGCGMLKGISPVVSPDLLKVLAEMGHGDEIVFSDAHFPAHYFGKNCNYVLRADGLKADQLLAAIVPLFELDCYATPVVMMAAVEGDTLDPKTEANIRAALGYQGPVERVAREAFYDRAKRAYAIVATSDVAQYGNVILKKGNTPAEG